MNECATSMNVCQQKTMIVCDCRATHNDCACANRNDCVLLKETKGWWWAHNHFGRHIIIEVARTPSLFFVGTQSLIWCAHSLLYLLQCSVFHGPPDLGGGLGGGRAHLAPPPPEKILGGDRRAPPPKGQCFDFLRGAKRAIFAPKSGQKWPNFPARAKGAREIPQRAYKSLQIGSNLRKNGSKTQKLLQKCPWWRKSVHIASKTLKTTPKYVKTALRAPKARAKNFSQNLAPPPEFLSGGQCFM